MRFQIAALALLSGLLQLGCEDPPRPWAGRPQGRVNDESTAFLPHRDRPVWLGDAGIAAAGGDDGAPQEPAQQPVSGNLGGLWVSCFEGFTPSGEPMRDVTRLGLMCGPVNGLDKVGDTHSGHLSSGEVASHAFGVHEGDCFRIFAVAEPSINDLDVEVVSSRGSRLTGDETDDRWPIIERRRPFCSFDDDLFTARVSAEGDSGRYALEVWRLPRTRPME